MKITESLRGDADFDLCRGQAGAASESEESLISRIRLIGRQGGENTAGARLTITETGFACLGLPVDEPADCHRANSLNWPGKLDLLRAECEHTEA
ncbi:hypothetical protein [Streptomyces guryensis]|uniref:Uncharacterized protein n=1 Tax=Streptomyces guryensis TaxID=2886947 RepID=A0A9Q3VYL1_9ACTN|nr:hypothetical protein [Streptomyces guryensis]MCD9879938.1 hypothetical protein [Streptomyces guryensis]